MAEQNYKIQLLHHCDLSGLSFRFEDSATGPSHDPSFTSYVFVNDERRGEGQAKTKKAALYLACRMALLSLQNQENHEAARPVGNVAAPGNPVVSSPRDVVSPSQVNGAAGNVLLDANYIGLFNEFCQRNKCLDSSFVDVRRGPSHLPEFFCSAVIGESRFPEARGKNKKEARQNAAHLALRVLKPQYPGDLQLQQIPGLDDVEEAEESNSQSESSEDSSSSSAQRMENEPSQSESSDSQAQPVGNVAAPGNPVVSSPRDVVSPSQVNGAAGNVMLDANYIGWFNDFCQRNKLDSSFVDVRRGPSHLPEFFCSAVIGESKFPEARGKNKKEARQNAAHLALRVLKPQYPGDLQLQQIPGLDYVEEAEESNSQSESSEDSSSSSAQRMENEPSQSESSDSQAQPVGNVAAPGNPVVSSPRDVVSPSQVNGAAGNVLLDANYIGLFNEFCQRNKCLDSSFVDARRGPSHLPEFFCSAVIGESKFPEARGKNKKEARQNAAHLALRVLKPQYPGDLQLQQIPGLDDVVEAEESNSQSESSEDSSSSSAQRMENEPSQSESSDSQVTFHSSFTGTPLVPNRQHRRIELAAKFSNLEPRHNVTTEDKIFQQDFDNITMLDSGGYGTVYKARKKLDQKYYVVKKVKRRSEKDEFEIQTLAQFEHKNIVRYYHSWAGEDICTDQSSSGRRKVESLFIQMEWCANGTLERWIKNMETIDKCRSLDIFRQIIDGVVYIHSNKLIHRDLKPANILFAEDMTVKIADFGLVTPISEIHKNGPLLRTVGRGTERYMAPEQESATYENEVDIFPLGLILIELFWKFDNKNKSEVWEKLRNAELPSKFVQQFPSEEQIIKLMLSKEPKKRPKASYLKEYFEKKSIYQSKTR